MLDGRWLHDPRRVFPVRIDPDVYFTKEQDCSLVSQGYANVPLCGERLYVGADTSTPKDVGRSLLHFELSSIPRNSQILRSRLTLWFEAHTGESPIEIEAHALTRAYTHEATWNKYNGTSTWSTAGGDYSPFTDGETKVQAKWAGERVSWGFTPQVEQWVREPSSNYGILLKAHDETVSGYDTFVQTGNTEKKPEPEMEVIYEPRMGTLPGQMIVSQFGEDQNTFNVNVTNGNLNVATHDVVFQGKGYETVLGRSYNSQDDNHLIEFDVCNKKTTKGIVEGASGSPVFKDYRAFGIISGHLTEADEAGCLGLYEGINNAEYALNVHILTGILFFTDLS